MLTERFPSLVHWFYFPPPHPPTSFPVTSLLLAFQQLYSVKETPQHTEEEVGPFTKLIEAMGFTGPLKYRKWVSCGGRG